MWLTLIKGLFIGFAIAAPVGPIGVLCIQRSLRDGFRIGLMTGLGAAFADGTYGLVAALGLTAVSALLVKEKVVIRLIGGLFLLYLGVKTILTPTDAHAARVKPEHSSLHACLTTYFLTLTNPMTILSFIGIFAGLGVGSQHKDALNVLCLVGGITLGSAAWWVLLSGGLAYCLRQRISTRAMHVINALSGGIILLFGLVALGSLV